MSDNPEIEKELSQRPSLARDADLLGRRNSGCRRWLEPHIRAAVRGFEEQATRSKDLDTWWNCYNVELDDNQFFNGNARVGIPIIRDAINARTTRFANQCFPTSGRFVDAAATDGSQPYPIVALLNHYIRDSNLKTQIVKPLLRNGDIEGQYNLYYGWSTFKRQVVSRETRGQLIEIGQGQFVEAPGAEVVDIIEEEIEFGRPTFEVLHDSDVLILPATSDSIEHAIACGGSVTVVRRWSKAKFAEMQAAGELRPDAEFDEMKVNDASGAGLRDLLKQLAKAVGIRAKGPHAMVFETWLLVPLSERGGFSERGTKRLCRLWWGLDMEPLGLKRNPYWCDRVPLSSVPVEKVAGIAKGKSLVEPLAPLQWEANDAANERADADHFNSMPIIMRKPGENNAPLILNLGAIWDIDPNDVKFAAFPDLSERARARIVDATQIIFQSLGVNPAMLPQQTGVPGRKRNQAEIAMEQSVDLLTTAEQVSVLEVVLNEAVRWIVDLDHQFRDRDLTVRAFGELGKRAEMLTVPPLQNGTHYDFRWAGAEQARLNAAMMQQGIALLNVARGLEQPLRAEGKQLHVGPALERAFQNVFGPVLGAQTLVDLRDQLAVSAEMENDLLAEGHMVPVHPLDPDPEHLKAHTEAAKASGDPHGTFRVHIQMHLMQMAEKSRAAMAAMAAQGAPGVPGGAGPGVAGTPRPGAPQPGGQVQGPRMMKGPPGMIPPEAMPRAGAPVMPRRF